MKLKKSSHFLLIVIRLTSCLSILYSPILYSANICYFSLNNLKEFTEMEKFTSKINKFSKNKITVKEFVTTGDDAEDAFLKMVESGEKCDGLVISGHHTGGFGGKNVSSGLSIDLMEKLSCNPEYKDFFSNIKALWLQGCRTLGVTTIAANEGADFHTDRVGAVLQEDHLVQSLAQLNMEFSATLDQDNPLSSRYLRIFPRATTFGWTKTAPGENAHSEYSIPFHIANIATLNDDRGKYFDNPIEGKINPKSALKYVAAINQVLGFNLNGSKIKCDHDEKTAVKAWLKQGNIKESRYSFDNPDLNAFESLYKSNNPELIKAGKLSCELLNCDDSSLLGSLENVLKSESILAYSFNTINEVILRLESEGKKELREKVQAKLKESKLLQSFLSKKMSSPDLGVLRKIDYYSFWINITDDKNKEVEKSLNSILAKTLSKPIAAGDYDRIDFLKTLINSMIKHDLLTTETIDEILKSPESSKQSLFLLLEEFKNINGQNLNLSKILKKIISIEDLDESVLRRVVSFLQYEKIPFADKENILFDIAKSPSASSDIFDALLREVDHSIFPISNVELVFEKIISSKFSGRPQLMLICKFATEGRYQIKDFNKIFQGVMNSPMIVKDDLSNIAGFFMYTNPNPPAGWKEKMLQKVLEHKLADEDVRKYLAGLIIRTRANADEMLFQIIATANKDSLLSILASIERENSVSKTLEKAIKYIVFSKNSDLEIFQAIQDMLNRNKNDIFKSDNDKISNSVELLELIEKNRDLKKALSK